MTEQEMRIYQLAWGIIADQEPPSVQAEQKAYNVMYSAVYLIGLKGRDRASQAVLDEDPASLGLRTLLGKWMAVSLLERIPHD